MTAGEDQGPPIATISSVCAGPIATRDRDGAPDGSALGGLTARQPNLATIQTAAKAGSEIDVATSPLVGGTGLHDEGPTLQGGSARGEGNVIGRVADCDVGATVDRLFGCISRRNCDGAGAQNKTGSEEEAGHGTCTAIVSVQFGPW